MGPGRGWTQGEGWCGPSARQMAALYPDEQQLAWPTLALDPSGRSEVDSISWWGPERVKKEGGRKLK